MNWVEEKKRDSQIQDSDNDVVHHHHHTAHTNTIGLLWVSNSIFIIIKALYTAVKWQIEFSWENQFGGKEWHIY